MLFAGVIRLIVTKREVGNLSIFLAVINKEERLVYVIASCLANCKDNYMDNGKVLTGKHYIRYMQCNIISSLFFWNGTIRQALISWQPNNSHEAAASPANGAPQ